MSIELFSDECAGCRPAMIDMTTGKPVPEDAAFMRAILGVWAGTTRGERLAWHRVTCQNSRNEMDMLFCHGLQKRFQAAINAASEP